MNFPRIIIAAVVGGLVTFLWGAIEHEATPLGAAGMENIPAEQSLLPQMKQAIKAPGLYMFPGYDMTKKDEASQKDYEARLKKGPTGLLFINPTGREINFPALLLIEFLSNAFAALILAVVLARFVGGWVAGGLLGAFMGVYGWASIMVSYWNWYEFPGPMVFASLVEQAIGGLVAGLAVALVLGERKQKPAV